MSIKIMTPVLTIFDNDGAIDYEGNKLLIKHLLDNGIKAMVPLGSTGEFTGISYEDRKLFIDFYLDQTNGKAEIYPGTGCVTPEQTIELSNYALDRGAKGVLIIGQYYFGMTQDDIFHYYDYLATHIKGDVYLYNFPARTKTDFNADTIIKLLRKHKNIVGIKESVSGFAHTRDLMYQLKPEFSNFKVFSGFDDQFLDNVDYGGVGSIGALSNLFPELWSNWVEAKTNNDYDTVVRIKKQILSLMRLYQIECNCSGLFKHILNRRGLKINTTTLFPFEDVAQESIDEAMQLINDVLN